MGSKSVGCGWHGHAESSGMVGEALVKTDVAEEAEEQRLQVAGDVTAGVHDEAHIRREVQARISA